MREVLVDHERHRRARKRDGGERVTLSSIDPPDPSQDVDLLALDQALDALERIDARKARVIELRVFAGLEFDEVAKIMNISRATLARDFRAARAWLYEALDLPLPDSTTP
jgi:RNA polymerase sigma factor (TIGR02999 family)